MEQERENLIQTTKKAKKLVLPKNVVEGNDIRPLYLTIDEVQRLYLPISKKRIRKICNDYLRTIRVGNKILVDRKDLDSFLSNPNVAQI